MKGGVYPAAVTPMDERGRIDMPGVARLLAWFRSEGCTGVVVAGTTGEGPSLSAIEKRELVKAAVPLADGMPVILGVATPSLEEAAWSCRQAHDAGAAAALVMPPMFFRDASEEGIALWYEALLARSPLPILVYNFPKRTGLTLSAELMARLARHERMLGLKDSSGDAANLPAYAEAARDKLLFVGDETLLVEALSHGWSGTISGAANAIPRWLSRIVGEWPENRESASVKHTLVMPTLRALREAPQPGTNKAILRDFGVLPGAHLRLPLIAPEPERYQEALRAVRSYREAV